MQNDECKQYTDKKVAELEQSIKTAFIDGDYTHHKTTHEKEDADNEHTRELWQGVKEKTMTGVIWAAILFLGTAAWEYVVRLLTHIK
jgi:hypothetical protein